jgi:hypothetical protein
MLKGIVVAGIGAGLAFEQVEQAVKTHGRAAIGGKIETVHGNILKKSNLHWPRPGKLRRRGG